MHLEDGARNGYQQKVAGREFRLEVDQGGHLVGVRFGGPGEGINLVAMSKESSQSGKGSWYEMESHWADVLKKDPGADLRVQNDVDYPAGSKRPEEFQVTYSVDGGRPVRNRFTQ